MTEAHEREASFHDAWARSVELNDIDVRAAFEAPTAVENKFILRQMGSLHGKRVLDLGVGFGESSVYFALLGAEVTACDISPKMLDTAHALAKLHGVKIKSLASPFENLNVEQQSFDFVYVANVLHHIQDRDAFFQNIHNVLRPGGRFFTWDPLAYNPVINLYRRMAKEVRTEDEQPLRISDLKRAEKYFSQVRHREFWISSLVLFLKYFLKDRVHPNADRYWKRILRESPSSIRWLRPFQAIDRVLTRIPLVRYLAWNTVIWGTKA